MLKIYYLSTEIKPFSDTGQLASFSKEFSSTLKNYKDIYQLGIFDISKDYIKIIEWPELIKIKPKDRLDLFFYYTDKEDVREVKIKSYGRWKDYKLDDF